MLVFSLWRESLGRVPMEAMANGIPVVASDRGPLPETLGSAGFVFTIPGRYTAHTVDIPTAREAAPWLAAIEKLCAVETGTQLVIDSSCVPVSVPVLPTDRPPADIEE